MPFRKTAYKLTEGDRAIFAAAAAEDNPTRITNFYLRDADSGTYWDFVTDEDIRELEFPQSIQVALRWQQGHENLMDIWKHLKKPDYFGPSPFDPEDWHVWTEPEYLKLSEELNRVFRVRQNPLFPSHPTFHYPHGIQFLPWQLDMWRSKHPIQVVPGGYGCIAPETRIYDAELNQHVSVEQLHNEGRAPKVLAWDGNSFVKAQAGVPWIKGTTDLYRVRTQSGREIVVTMDHRFLTLAGWKKLREISAGDAVLSSGQSLPQSSSGLSLSMCLEDAHHCSRTEPIAQCGCQSYSLCDEQLLLGSDSAPNVPPSQVGVLGHTHSSSLMDDLGVVGIRTPCSSCAHLSMKGSSFRADLPGFAPGCHSCAESDELAPPALVSPGHQLSQGMYIHEKPNFGSDESVSPGLMGVSYGDPCCCRLHQDVSSVHQVSVLEGQDELRHSSMFQARQTVTSTLHGSCSDTSSAFESPIYLNGQYDEVVSIEWEREGVFYDITVPGYENYLAEGFVNHNSAKTYGKMLAMLVRAVTLPGYQALALAPFARQAEEVYNIAMQIITGTRFEKFLVGAPTKPRPKLIFDNDLTGMTTIECFPGDDPSKFLTLTIDEVLIDQAEKMDGNGTATISELVRSLGTRFRGRIHGRQRLGQMSFVANSADNPELWDLFDDSASDPKYIWAKSPSTFENIYLTVKNLKDFEKQVGKDETSRRMYLLGERPIGSGEHFSAESLEKCRSRELDQLMSDNLDKGTEGWVKREADKVAIHRWERPYEEGGTYIVVADPGWGNPPNRNSACIGVFKIDQFPRVPAQLVAFDWVFGHNSPNPWIARFIEYVYKYHAVGMNGFDATGPQAGYEKVPEIQACLPYPVLLQHKKYAYLNLTKKFFASGYFSLPYIPHMFSQLAKYALPDEGLRQDIVSMLFIASAMLEIPYSVYLAESSAGYDQIYDYDDDDRYFRPASDRDFEYEFSVREDR